MDRLTRVRAAKLAARRVLRAASMVPAHAKTLWSLDADLEARIEKAVARALDVGRDQERARVAALARARAAEAKSLGRSLGARQALEDLAAVAECPPPGE